MSFNIVMIKRIAVIIIFLCFSEANGNTFSEVFGSEGAAGIENPKTRSLSYTLQYATLAGSVGYVLKQLHDSGFLEPLGYIPESFQKLSPLVYKNNYILDKHSANIIAVNQNVDKINYLNDLKSELAIRRYSVNSIEMRNNKNLLISLDKFNNRNILLEKYYEK